MSVRWIRDVAENFILKESVRRDLFACVGVGLQWCLRVGRIRGRGDLSYLSAFTG